MYQNFRIKANAILMKNVPNVLLTYETDVELFKEYLRIFGDSLQPNEYGNTLLHQAAELGCINIMKLLVEHAKDMNVQNQNLHTPLAMAVKNGKIEIVKFLLSTSKVSKVIILKIQYFGVQARSRARQPKDVYHFKITQLKLNAL